MAETSVYDIFKNAIYSGDFELVDTKKRIMSAWAYGSLTDEQRDELIATAREQAKPESSYKPLQEQLTALGERVKALETKVEAIEQKGSSTGSEATEEYPAYQQPTGSTDAYQVGDKVTFNDKHYTCTLDGCVWSPEDYPSAWQEATEEVAS